MLPVSGGRTAAAIAVIDMEPIGGTPGSFIILKRHDHDRTVQGWCLPGGCLEPGETPEQAVVREVREETGYDVHITKKLFSDDADVNGQPFHIHAFAVRITGGSLLLFPNEEHKNFLVTTGVPNLTGIRRLTRRAIREATL